jgi:hypothetical protein
MRQRRNHPRVEVVGDLRNRARAMKSPKSGETVCEVEVAGKLVSAARSENLRERIRLNISLRDETRGLSKQGSGEVKLATLIN